MLPFAHFVNTNEPKNNLFREANSHISVTICVNLSSTYDYKKTDPFLQEKIIYKYSKSFKGTLDDRTLCTFLRIDKKRLTEKKQYIKRHQSFYEYKFRTDQNYFV